MALNYTGGLTAYFGVSDFDAAIAWYTEKLEFTLEYRIDEMGWCEMRCPVENVLVGLSRVDDVKPGGGAILVWAVANIEAARSDLESRGVAFEGETMVIPDMVKLATFKDPDGNTLMLSESLSS